MITNYQAVCVETVSIAARTGEAQVGQRRVEWGEGDSLSPGPLNCLAGRVLRVVSDVKKETGIRRIIRGEGTVHMVAGVGNAGREDVADGRAFITTGQESIPKVLESCSDVRGVRAEREDSENSSVNQTSEDARRVCRPGRDVEVQIQGFAVKTGMDGLVAKGEGEIEKDDRQGAWGGFPFKAMVCTMPACSWCWLGFRTMNLLKKGRMISPLGHFGSFLLVLRLF